MHEGDRNYGIYQSGSGTIDSSGPMAVGRQAVANSGTTKDRPPTAAEALADLRRLLAEHGAGLPDPARAQARGEIEEISDLLDSPGAEPGRLSAALTRLSASIASVTALATGAEALRTAVERLFG